MPKNISKEDLDLLGELGIDTTTKKQAARTPKEQRIIAGYEEIERFLEEHNRLPEHGEDSDIFERLYAVRLDQLRSSSECRELLKDIDTKSLLQIPTSIETATTRKEDPSDYEILKALGLHGEGNDSENITELKYVRSTKEKLDAEETAQRVPCQNFGIFKPLFEQLKQDLDSNSRKTLKYKDNGEVKKGDFFIVEGQKSYVADWGELFINNSNRPDRRLLVIYDNGTESDLLLRSMQRALNRDKTSRRITDSTLGPLFSDQEEAEDQASGYVYVLESKSENHFILENQKVIHKIGITKGSVEKRISNAAKDPTYLLAGVKIVQTYKVSNLNLTKLEKLLHKFFDPARLDLELKDRFGFDVEPREWFLVPLSVIEEAVKKLINGTLPDYRYEPAEGRIIKI